MSSYPSPPGTKRDCACPIARHEHGTTGGYDADRCRCLDCRAAAAAAYRRRYRLKAYGQFSSHMVGTTGTRRRCHALMTLGWPLSTVADMTGMNRRQLDRNLGECNEMLRSTADKIARVYDELWNTPAVGTTKRERIAVSKTLARARRCGYAPPLAWDDDTIDDPTAKPYRQLSRTPAAEREALDEIAISEACFGRKVELTNAERAEAVRQLTERGYSARAAAEFLCTTPRLITRKRASNRAVAGGGGVAA